MATNSAKFTRLIGTIGRLEIPNRFPECVCSVYNFDSAISSRDSQVSDSPVEMRGSNHFTKTLDQMAVLTRAQARSNQRPS